jgi:hypothetical protein
MSGKFRLITISVSHYSEKARWALEYLEIPFQELPYMPPFHPINHCWSIWLALVSRRSI